MQESEQVPVESVDLLDDKPQYFPHEVEVVWDVVDLNERKPGKPKREFVAFHVPETLPKVRSAFCNDPLFREALQLYIDKQSEPPEQVMRENTSQRLTVEKRRLSADHFDDTEADFTLGVREHEHVAVNQNPAERDEEVEDTPESIEAVKSEYVDGELTELELEQELERVISE